MKRNKNKKRIWVTDNSLSKLEKMSAIIKYKGNVCLITVSNVENAITV